MPRAPTNPPTIYRWAHQSFALRKIASKAPPDWRSGYKKRHRRIDMRHLYHIKLDEEVATFPGARQLLLVTRSSTCLRTGRTSVESRIFITSIEPGEKTPAQLAALVRGQWSIENKNHWKRDTCRWREDRGPRRQPNGSKNLGLMRGALMPVAEFDSLNAALDHYASHPWQALALLTKTAPFQN